MVRAAGFTIPGLEFVPRVGETYRIKMQPQEGGPFYLTGELREVDPPVRLAYTFVWEDPDPDDVETLVGLSLRDLGGSTEIDFTQGTFKTEARRTLHRDGWTRQLRQARTADLRSGIVGETGLVSSPSACMRMAPDLLPRANHWSAQQGCTRPPRSPATSPTPAARRLRALEHVP